MLFGKLMLQQPNVLVMDEPTNHLDMESIESLNSALGNYPGTLIFVSHDLGSVARISDRVALFEAGRLVEIGSPGEVISQYQGLGRAAQGQDRQGHARPGSRDRPDQVGGPQHGLDRIRHANGRRHGPQHGHRCRVVRAEGRPSAGGTRAARGER